MFSVRYILSVVFLLNLLQVLIANPIIYLRLHLLIIVHV